MMYAEIRDPNLSGAIAIEVESTEELRDLLADKVGRWHDFDGNGVALLSEPEAWVYTVKPDHDADCLYPDFIVTSTSIERA